MSDHEFRGEAPSAAPARGLEPGTCTPEAGAFACASCPEAITATLITMEKDEALPICQTCGPMTRWVKQT